MSISIYTATIDCFQYSDDDGCYTTAMFTTRDSAQLWLQTQMSKISPLHHWTEQSGIHCVEDGDLHYQAYVRTDTVFETVEAEAATVQTSTSNLIAALGLKIDI